MEVINNRINKFLSVIIPTYNRSAVFGQTIKSAYHALKEFDNYEILVINDSKNQEVVIPIEFSNGVMVYENKKSGVAAARNYGAYLAKGEWLLFLDDDMILSEDNVNTYFKYTELNQKICVNIEWEYPADVLNEISKKPFGRFLIKYGFTTMRGWSNYPDWDKNAMVLVNAITSPNLFIRKTDFISTNGYDESFPYAGFEDYAFSKQLEKNQFKMYIDTNSMMYHNEIDRLEPKAWFERKVRGSETRKIAVQNGFMEIDLKYNRIKKIMYQIQVVLQPFLYFVLFFTTLFKWFDFVSFACYKRLLGIAIFKGFTK
jgi:glycosyltransferase involved in cell wall biosynthesis